MTCLKSYDLNGKKLSFANWISNLSPQETPFTSMTGKESVNQTLFQWQNDALNKAGQNAVKEGEDAIEGSMRTTTVRSNVTQILRKVVKVSDTANALANYGRGQELQYQMEKAGKELKRDLEFAFLNNGGAVHENGINPRETAGFHALVAGKDVACPETGAVVHKVETTIDEAKIFGMTYNLYLAGSSADIVMFHPKWAATFSALQEKASTRLRIFEDTPKFSVYVSSMVDPLGQNYKLIPNRWMAEDKIYFFNASDFTQMVLRAPNRIKLAKDGSYEKWMIEMEVGLRLRHPFAAGVLEIAEAAAGDHGTDNKALFTTPKIAGVDMTDASAVKAGAELAVGAGLPIEYTPTAKSTVRLLKDGVEVYSKHHTDASKVTTNAISSVTMAEAGIYVLEGVGDSDHATLAGKHYLSEGLAVRVKRAAVAPETGDIETPAVRKRAAKKAEK